MCWTFLVRKMWFHLFLSSIYLSNISVPSTSFFCCPLSPLIFLKGPISSISPVVYSQRVNYSRGPRGPALYQVDPRLVCHFVYAAVYLTRSRVRGPSRDGPLIVTLTPELNNNPHYGVADSSWKSWFMNMLGAEACCLYPLALHSILGRRRPCASTFLLSPFPLSVLVITGTLHQENEGWSESLKSEINGSWDQELKRLPLLVFRWIHKKIIKRVLGWVDGYCRWLIGR